MSARSHPCQLLADVQTFVECRGPIQDKTVAFVGDGYNMCNSYIDASRQFGFDLKIACPKGFEPHAEMLATTNRATIGRIRRRKQYAVPILVVTDVWSSMGHESEESERRKRFAGYQVDASLLDRGSAAMRCSCIVCPHTAAKRSVTTCSTIRARSCGPKPAIGCIRRRRYWNFSAATNRPDPDQFSFRFASSPGFSMP